MTLDDLRKIAEEATPGPWERDGAEIGQPFTCPEPWETVVSNEVECGAFCLGGVARGIAKGADAEFIATFNPERVLELLDENEQLTQRVKRLSHHERRNAKQRDECRDRLAAVENCTQISTASATPAPTKTGHCLGPAQRSMRLKEKPMTDTERSERIDQAISEYPEVGEYLEAIRGNVEALASRLAAVEEVHERREYWTETGEDICDTCSRRKQGDFEYWPCETIKAARGE